MCLFWILFQVLIILYISYLTYLLADSGSQTNVSSCFIENSNGLFLKGYLNLSTCEDPDELHKLLVPSYCVSCLEHSTDRAASGKDPSASEISNPHFWYLLLPKLSVSAKLLFSNWLKLPTFWVAFCTLGKQNEMWLLLHLCYSLSCTWNLGAVEHYKLGRKYGSLLPCFLF